MIRLSLIFLSFFTLGAKKEIAEDERLREALKVQSRFPSYRIYYDYKKTIKEVKEEIESGVSEEDKEDDKS